MSIAVLSDIHGNLDALRAVLADMDALGVAGAVSLGDVIGYGPDPEACLALLRERGIPTVMGNHEHAMLRESHKRWFNPQSRAAVEITETLIGPDTREALRTLPTSLVRGGARFVHGYPPDNLHLYLHAVSDERLGQTLAQMAEEVCFVGHTHDLAWIRWDNGHLTRGTLAPGVLALDPGCRYLLNVGSVGQPRDDFDTTAKYVLHDPAARRCEVRRVAYDARPVAARMLAQGVPETFIRRLGSGR
ncbi:metallophosphoesterase family protein [Desulfocurvus sp.]|jgi:predicted phosphodiesterase|uniref:metallophosphoesterase family protein n=1 Tax=Desulfocurvus sp. TaxID=2871698 RepID=UPI0025C13906|nr:metallophosphoesterase family protein [Desulfocurvus sp.]MCK9241107.1 metallophosphoesterase family protein [Desulfocurvus sp.]